MAVDFSWYTSMITTILGCPALSLMTAAGIGLRVQWAHEE